ncbi:predicted protein [Arabidopsis lyrata subsp. lyrata]|uniref:Predicted protein n=1 Tax=Arabidopsis lyrata subsp. lyrata TaxID=81972 RepID=D7L5W5_ARALL|nr:predicted protein [Arabidopsis lyrata subsp. lyrata]
MTTCLVEDFAKPVFMVESAMASIDFQTLQAYVSVAPLWKPHGAFIFISIVLSQIQFV